MGMRTDQYIGLTEAACLLVRGERVIEYHSTETREFPDGKRVIVGPVPIYGSTVKRGRMGKIDGAFGNEFPLYAYTFPDGRVLTEYVQAEPWSSGPCYFVALKDEEGKPVTASLWSQSEINNA